jgi:transcription elongation GreA/GreB family factor
MPINKRFFVEQLRQQFVSGLAITMRAEYDAREASRHMATESEKKEDGRVAIEFGNLAGAQALRARQARGEIEALDTFARQSPSVYSRNTPIGLGAIIDLADASENGAPERTFILLPVGAGAELTGPNGDGFLSVITPASPIGKALVGKRVGDIVEVMIHGEVREWSIADVS